MCHSGVASFSIISPLYFLNKMFHLFPVFFFYSEPWWMSLSLATYWSYCTTSYLTKSYICFSWYHLPKGIQHWKMHQIVSTLCANWVKQKSAIGWTIVLGWSAGCPWSAWQSNHFVSPTRSTSASSKAAGSYLELNFLPET